MKTRRNINNIVAYAACGMLALGCVAAYLLYANEAERNQELQTELEKLTKQEQQSVVMQRMNAQMEEIANEERRISDEQREAAEQQTQVAEQERQNAELQRQQAEQERQNALTAERKAIEASKVAEQERVKAEQQRANAEQAKRTTDTLSYLTLARSLGSAAITQYNSGNTELADMLAFCAVGYTQRYHGDLYASTVYQSLAMTSQNKSVWNKHKGSVTDIAFYDDISNDFISCSTYGEVMKHHRTADNLTTKILVKNPHYDFRDVYIQRDKVTIYAVSRTSELVIIDNNGEQTVVAVNIPKLFRLETIGNQFILIGESGIALFDTNTNTVVKTKSLPYKIVTVTRYQNYPIIFDNQGQEHLVKSFDNITTSRVPYTGQVTAFAESKSKHIKAYGMSDGTIYLTDAKGKTTKLAGHRSRISKIKINGDKLYSASYDGTMILWMTGMSKIEPMPLFTTGGWIVNFTYDLKKENIWTGDQKGNLTEALISWPHMYRRLKNKLKRNFTRTEWEYYIGKDVPYTEILGKEVFQ